MSVNQVDLHRFYVTQSNYYESTNGFKSVDTKFFIKHILVHTYLYISFL